MSDIQSEVNRQAVQSIFFAVCVENTDKLGSNDEKLEQFVLILITTAVLSTKFVNKIFVDILHDNVQAQKNWEVGFASVAFKYLEKLLLKLYHQPWRKELKSIKVYTGFFQLQIEKYIHGAEKILQHAGYNTRDGQTFVIGKLDRKHLLEVACDANIASAECKMMHEIYVRVQDDGCSMWHVFKCRREEKCNVEQAVSWIRKNYPPSEQLKYKPEGKESEQVFVGEGAKLKRPVETNIYSNSKFVAGIKQPSHLSMQKKRTQDSGYISEPSKSRELKISPEMNTPSMSTVKYPPSDNQTYKHALQHADPNVPCIDCNTKGMQFEEDSGHDDSHLERIESVDDIYTEGTHDDMIQKSMQMLQQDHPIAKRETVSRPNKPGSEEWDFVRKELIERDEHYYDGERGDVLEIERRSVPVFTRPPRPEDMDARHNMDAIRMVQEAAAYNKNTQQQKRTGSFPTPTVRPCVMETDDNKATEKMQRLAVDSSTSHPISPLTKQQKISSPKFITPNPSPHYQARNIYSSTPTRIRLPSSPLQTDGLPRSLPSPGITQRTQFGQKYTEPKSMFGKHAFDTTDYPMKSGEWTCTSCTYVNRNTDVCSVCSRSRFQNPELKRLESGGHDCPQCTLVNPVGNTECDACSYPLEGTPTYL